MTLVAAVLCGAFLHFRPSAKGQRASEGGLGGNAAAVVLVHTMAAAQGDMTINVDALGTVTPIATVNVYSQAGGQIVGIHYREGQMVQRGDALVDIDPRPYRAQLEQVMGTLDRDRAYLRQTQIDLERYRMAYAEHAVAKQILDDQEQAVAQYQGAVRNDEGQVSYAQVQLGYCHIVAPISGRLGLRLVDTGNTIFAGSASPLAVLTSVQPITVVFNIPEDRLAAVRESMRPGRSLSVLALDRNAQTTLATGHLQSLDNQIDTATGTLRLRAEFANTGLQLYPNQFVNARLQLKTLHGLTLVPTAAVQRNGTQAYLFVAHDGKAVIRKVAEITTDGQRTAVDNVQPGETIITTSFDRLQDGAAITTSTAAPTAAPGEPAR